ncbi:MAG: RNA pseudouridine synthase, partial [Paenisporosarcina sp.]
HLAHIKHPLVGDELYGGSIKDLTRSALHCSSLTIKHPLTKEMMKLEAPLPKDMSEFLAAQTN